MLSSGALFFSLDSMTPETLKIVRGVDKLEKIKRNLFMMLDVRGNATLPRIGATFTVQRANEHELDDFVDYWTQHADVVRVGGVLSRGRSLGLPMPGKARPLRVALHDDADSFQRQRASLLP